MKIKDIKNFEIYANNYAFSISTRNEVKLIEVAKINKPEIRALFTYPNCQLYDSNFEPQELNTVQKEVLRVLPVLKEQ